MTNVRELVKSTTRIKSVPCLAVYKALDFFVRSWNVRSCYRAIHACVCGVRACVRAIHACVRVIRACVYGKRAFVGRYEHVLKGFSKAPCAVQNFKNVSLVSIQESTN